MIERPVIHLRDAKNSRVRYAAELYEEVIDPVTAGTDEAEIITFEVFSQELRDAPAGTEVQVAGCSVHHYGGWVCVRRERARPPREVYASPEALARRIVEPADLEGLVATTEWTGLPGVHIVPLGTLGAGMVSIPERSAATPHLRAKLGEQMVQRVERERAEQARVLGALGYRAAGEAE